MDKKAIAKHVVNLSAGGKLHNSRANHTPASQIPQIFDGFAQSGLQSMTLYFHGGLVDESAGFATAARLLPAIHNDFASYPVFLYGKRVPSKHLSSLY